MLLCSILCLCIDKKNTADKRFGLTILKVKRGDKNTQFCINKYLEEAQMSSVVPSALPNGCNENNPPVCSTTRICDFFDTDFAASCPQHSTEP